MLAFDSKTTQQLERAYAGADVIRRRRGSFDAVDPVPGETIVDIGCGNGLLTAELARAVGEDGCVIGVDPSDDMRGAAEARCAEFPWVSLRAGRADAIPVDTAQANKAVSVQVFEYIDDIPAALAEAHRILHPGGRLVIADIHFGSFIWASDDPRRMRDMMASWDHHLADPRLPERMPHELREAGFGDIRMTSITLNDTVMKPDGLALMMMRLMAAYAVSNGHLPKDVVRAWSDEQEARAREGRFFFSITQFILTATKA